MSDSDDEQSIPTNYDEEFFKNRARSWVNEDLYHLDDSGNYMTRSKQWVVSHIQPYDPDYLLDYTQIYDHYLSLLKKERAVIEELLSELVKIPPEDIKTNVLLKEVIHKLKFVRVYRDKPDFLKFIRIRLPKHKPQPFIGPKPSREVVTDEQIINIYLENDLQIIQTEKLPDFQKASELGEYFINRGPIKGVSTVRPSVKHKMSDGRSYQKTLYDEYVKKRALDEQKEVIPEKKPSKEDLKYPFKTKKLQSMVIHGVKETLPDYKMKIYKKGMMKPIFNNERGGYQLDLLSLGTDEEGSVKGFIMFLIGTNTRYVITKYLRGKSVEDIFPGLIKAFQRLSTMNVPINSIKSDAESALVSMFKNPAYEKDLKGIKLHWSGSPHTNHVRIVDRVMKTFRDALGPDYDNTLFEDYGTVKQLKDYYNDTPHKSLKIDGQYFTPTDFMEEPELEFIYIRQCHKKLKKVEENLRQKGLLDMKPGNIVQVAMSYGKTKKSFMKKRRTFNTLAMFMKYQNGNAVIRVLHPMEDEYTDVPLYTVNIIARNMKSLEGGLGILVENTFNCSIHRILKGLEKEGKYPGWLGK